MKEKDNSKSRQFLFKKIAEKIAKDIDNSFEKKVKEHRFNLAMYNTKETKLNYLDSEKSKLTKSIKESSYNSKRGLDNYLGYLSSDPNDNFLREEAIIFVIRDVFLEAEDLLNTVYENYIGYNREGPIKIYIEKASQLECNVFLIDEINRFNKSELKKLEWTGSKVELIELIKSLIENESIENGQGIQSDIVKHFENFFGIDLNFFDQTVYKITQRMNGKDKIFMDDLKDSLINFRDKSEQEKRDTSKKRKKTRG